MNTNTYTNLLTMELININVSKYKVLIKQNRINQYELTVQTSPPTR